MKYDSIMIRYGELSLKGKNKNSFIDTLVNNIRHMLEEYSELKYLKQHDRFYVILNDSENIDAIINKIKLIPGIHSFSLVLKCDKDIEKITSLALDLINKEEISGNTFKVKSSRSDKSFSLTSDDINRAVAFKILKNTSLKVDVHNPDILIHVELRVDACYLYLNSFEGLGGFPLGINGHGMLMISGGIDSPVAGFEMIKKGVKVMAIHFSSPPYTSDMAVFKVKTLLSKLASIQGQVKFINIPFTNLQLKIYETCGDSYAITIMRRMMYRLADYFATKEECLCIINGESIGQVASQTLESMQVINAVTNKVIIRPLAVMDKLDIIKIARNIDTYETSILPYEDCCTIFDPKNPVTKPKLKKCEELEAKFDYNTLIQEAIDNASIEIIKKSF